MKNVFGIIGLNYGDEGKGLMTDYIASNFKHKVVVRYNGGGQAGHTVQLPTGERHVFSHIGSGAFTGASTYLSKYFICNPIIFAQELAELNSHEIIKRQYNSLYVDKDCMVTTPYDIMVNRALEIDRGQNRHGSVGVGINATMQRNKVISMTIGDLRNSFTTNALNDIREYSFEQVSKLQSKEAKEYVDSLNTYFMDKAFFESFATFEKFTYMNTMDLVMRTHNTIIFEGAQGLLLDEQYGTMPYCTPSNCGAENIAKLIEGHDDLYVELIYVTRGYVTRHGAGPLPQEIPWPTEIEDKTNVFNQFQENLRYAPFSQQSISDLAFRMLKDSQHVQAKNKKISLALTWADAFEHKQLSEQAKYLSFGPTRANVVKK